MFSVIRDDNTAFLSELPSPDMSSLNGAKMSSLSYDGRCHYCAHRDVTIRMRVSRWLLSVMLKLWWLVLLDPLLRYHNRKRDASTTLLSQNERMIADIASAVFEWL